VPEHTDDDPAREAVLDELRRNAIETYGEERAAERLLQLLMESTATAIWRVSQEPIEPSGHEPVSRHA